MSGRGPWTELKAELDAVGFRPSKRFGQNFLLDDGVCGWIARSAELEPDETVLEIGVGLGFLTGHLLELAGRVVGVEIDARLAAIAQRRLGHPAKLEVIETDVLAGKHALDPAVVAALPQDSSWSLVANLPYAVASPVLVLLSRLPNPPRRMTILVQLEVAERLCATSGSPGWGPLTARLTPLYRARLGRRVSPTAFRPRPKVDSAVAWLDRTDAQVAEDRLERYDTLVSRLF
ncbi:MAG: 16S rRNA (adenine(1518)-N(6)/adenine(1519)-N(6))-dimethyltransferase RsmA, partial [Planctomycetota bacterium]